MWAKQSTAATLVVGPILDSTGAEFTTAVIGDLSLSKNGGTLTALTAAATLTHVANGQYTLVMTTGNLDTLGRAQITCNKATYQMPAVNLMVVPAMVFDSMILGTDVLHGDVTQIGGDTQSATDLKDFADAGYDPATNTVAAELDSATRVKLDASQPDYAPLLASGYTAPANSDITAIKAKTDNLPSDPADQSLVIAATDAVMGRLGAPAGASMSADIAAVKTDTGNLVSRITANLFSGITYLSRWLGALAGKTADTTTRTEINATTAGAGYNETTDSLEAQKDSGGGDATLAKQTEILAAVAGVTSSVASHAARLALEVQIQGFPSVICRNSDYVTETESEIRLTILDLTGTAITEIAGTPVASLAWLFGMGTESTPAIIAGAVTWDAGTSELVIQFARSVTAAKPLGSIAWQIGVSTGSGATLKNRWLGGGTTRLIERQF
jgi:hypothetical protein